MKAIGYNPESHLWLRQPKPADLAPILWAVEYYGGTTDPDNPEYKQMRELLQEYGQKDITLGWTEEAMRLLGKFEKDLQPALKNTAFGTLYDGYKLDAQKELPKPEEVSQTRPEPGTTLLRSDIEHAHTIEELDLAINGLVNGRKAAEDAGRPLKIPLGLESTYRQLAMGKDVFREYLEQDDTYRTSLTLGSGDNAVTVEGHMMMDRNYPVELPELKRKQLLEICADLEQSVGNRGFDEFYIAGKKEHLEDNMGTPDNPGTSRLRVSEETSHLFSEAVEEQKRHVKEVTGIYEMMKKEKSGLHINSSEYKEMREAARAVAEASYNPDDLQSVEDMKKKMDVLEAKTAAYARKTVWGKTKSTDLGLERKNWTLGLMSATNPSALRARELQGDVKDTRLSRSEKGKTPRTLSDLIDEEKKAAKGARKAASIEARSKMAQGVKDMKEARKIQNAGSAPQASERTAGN